MVLRQGLNLLDWPQAFHFPDSNLQVLGFKIILIIKKLHYIKCQLESNPNSVKKENEFKMIMARKMKFSCYWELAQPWCLQASQRPRRKDLLSEAGVWQLIIEYMHDQKVEGRMT